MKKHTVLVGTSARSETVRFTAKLLGKAEVPSSRDEAVTYYVSYYQLPDDTYRALLVRGDIRLLEPSNFADVLGTDQPVEYRSWTLEELRNEQSYGEVFTKLMKGHS
jgi:hypothetical protein